MIDTDFHRVEFADGEELAKGLADWTAERLRAAIAARGVALLVVSGGKSPARFFEILSNVDLDWTRVAITLADERRVADDSPRSNARLVRDKLLRNRAEAASFTPLADVRLPADRELAAASARIARSFPSTARPFQKRCWKANSSATRRAPSPAPSPAASASSRRPMAARCCSTKSRKWTSACRQSSCAPSRSG